MSSIDFRPVSEVEFRAFTSAFNHAYSDYYTPIHMTTHSFEALMTRDDLVKQASVVAVENGTIIGTGLLGIRGNTAWIGGMGVIPERRREGIGRQMMHYLIARARERHAAVIRLEVIEANTGAHALYQQLGFSDIRYLHIMVRSPGSPVPETEFPYHVMGDEGTAVLRHFDAFHRDIRNCWQRGRASLYGLTAVYAGGLAALSNSSVAGYALGWFTPQEIRTADLAVDPALGDARIQVATTLISHAHRKHPHAPGSAYNVADDDPILPAYHALGYTTDFRQIEMELHLEDA